MGVHGGNGGHVLLACEDELVVDDVVWEVSQAVERASGVELHGDAGAEVDVFADAFDFGRLVVVA